VYTCWGGAEAIDSGGSGGRWGGVGWLACARARDLSRGRVAHVTLGLGLGLGVRVRG